MTTVFWVTALLLLPILFILWLTESRSTRINRLRKNGATWKAIGNRYGVTDKTAKKWSLA